MSELLLSQALTLVAIGETFENSFETLSDMYPYYSEDRIYLALSDAYFEGLAQGLDPYDIDPSFPSSANYVKGQGA